MFSNNRSNNRGHIGRAVPCLLSLSRRTLNYARVSHCNALYFLLRVHARRMRSEHSKQLRRIQQTLKSAAKKLGRNSKHGNTVRTEEMLNASDEQAWEQTNLRWEHSHELEQRATALLYQIGAPILLVSGTFGNVMMFLVIGKVCRGTSTSVHFRNLAIFDTITAWTFLLPQFLYFAMDLKIHPVLQVVVTFLRYSSGDVSIWLVVVITVDRLIAVWKPIHVRRWCKFSRAMRILLYLNLIAVLKNISMLVIRINQQLTIQANYTDCNQVTLECGDIPGGSDPVLYYLDTTVRPLVAMITVCAVPAVTVTVCNSIITSIVCRSRRIWLSASWDTENCSNNHTCIESSSYEAKAGVKVQFKDQALLKNRRRSEKASLVLSVTNSTAFFIMLLPSFLVCVLHHGAVQSLTSDRALDELATAIGDLIMMCNHSFNFFICCAVSGAFRRKVVVYISKHVDRHRSKSTA